MTRSPEKGRRARSRAGASKPAGRTTGGPGLPSFRVLERAECEKLLAGNSVGRIAFSLHDRVDIEPLHYVYDAGWIYGRTSEGSKLAAMRHNQWIAFEVDEVEGVFDWKSVVAHGSFHVLSADGPAKDAEAWRHAIELLRTLIPETGTPNDPVPHRGVVLRIYVDEMTGRSATTSRRA